jgi:hypothetical protein
LKSLIIAGGKLELFHIVSLPSPEPCRTFETKEEANDEVKSVAYIRGQIFDQAEITGRFTKQAALDLSLVLRSGALPAPIRIIEEQAIK